VFVQNWNHTVYTTAGRTKQVDNEISYSGCGHNTNLIQNPCFQVGTIEQEIKELAI